MTPTAEEVKRYKVFAADCDGTHVVEGPSGLIADTLEDDTAFVLASDHDRIVSSLREEVAQLERACAEYHAEVERLGKDAAWGAHNGGAHQLLKIQHETSVELYNALREMSPNHAVVHKHYELSPEALSGYGSGAAKSAMEKPE